MSKRQFGYVAATISAPAVIVINNAEGWKLQSAIVLAFVLMIAAMAALSFRRVA